MIRTALCGATGKTGAAVLVGLQAADDIAVVARVARSLAGAGEGCYGSLAAALEAAPVDVVVDFTLPDAIEGHVAACLERRVAMVIGTTGLAPGRRQAIDAEARAAGVPLFFAANFALGAVLMMRFAEEAARVLPRAEIIELHHEGKLDAPSGTAAVTAERMRAAGAAEVAIHSVRLPGLVASQEVLFGAPGQWLTIRHDTSSREAFAPGVLLAVRRVRALPAGLTVGLDALLDGS